MTKNKKELFLIILVLVVSVAIASFCYRTYQYSPDYVIPDEFLEEYDEDEEDEEDSSFSAEYWLSIFEQIGSGESYSASESENSETYQIKVIEATTYYCAADNYLNVRAFPSSDSKVIDTVSRAEELEVYGFITLDTGEIWAEILYNEAIGFVSMDYLSEEPVSKYSQSDIYLLAQIMYAEAGGCDKAEMARVGQVVLNRINTNYSEFQCCTSLYTALYHTGAYPDTVRKIENGLVPSEEALQVAEGLLEGTIESGLSTNVLWQTGFEPNWQATVVYVSEWGHYYSVLAQ